MPAPRPQPRFARLTLPRHQPNPRTLEQVEQAEQAAQQAYVADIQLNGLCLSLSGWHGLCLGPPMRSTTVSVSRSPDGMDVNDVQHTDAADGSPPRKRARRRLLLPTNLAATPAGAVLLPHHSRHHFFDDYLTMVDGKPPATLVEELLAEFTVRHTHHHVSAGVYCESRRPMSAHEFADHLIPGSMFADLLRLSDLFPGDRGVRVLSRGYDNWIETGTCFPDATTYPPVVPFVFTSDDEDEDDDSTSSASTHSSMPCLVPRASDSVQCSSRTGGA